jgi:ribosome modulation factor
MRLSLSNLLGLALTSISCVTAANATVIVTLNPPPPREVVIIPKGHTSCTIIPAGIYNGMYVNEHKICHYSHNSQKSTWVSGHWQCTNYRPLRAICVSWAWIPSHWSSARTVIVS